MKLDQLFLRAEEPENKCELLMMPSAVDPSFPRSLFFLFLFLRGSSPAGPCGRQGVLGIFRLLAVFPPPWAPPLPVILSGDPVWGPGVLRVKTRSQTVLR